VAQGVGPEFKLQYQKEGRKGQRKEKREEGRKKKRKNIFTIVS
jgi:hypothetical protein